MNFFLYQSIVQGLNRRVIPKSDRELLINYQPGLLLIHTLTGPEGWPFCDRRTMNTKETVAVVFLRQINVT